MSSRGRTNTFAECLTRHSSRFHFRKSRARGLRQFQFDAFAPLPHSPLTITVTVTFRSARDFHSLAAHVEQLDILHVHVNRTASLLILRSPTRVLYTGLERYIATTLPNQLFKGPHVITTTDGRGIATSAWVSLISPTIMCLFWYSTTTTRASFHVAAGLQFCFATRPMAIRIVLMSRSDLVHI